MIFMKEIAWKNKEKEQNVFLKWEIRQIFLRQPLFMISSGKSSLQCRAVVTRILNYFIGKWMGISTRAWEETCRTECTQQKLMKEIATWCAEHRALLTDRADSMSHTHKNLREISLTVFSVPFGQSGAERSPSVASWSWSCCWLAFYWSSAFFFFSFFFLGFCTFAHSCQCLSFKSYSY